MKKMRFCNHCGRLYDERDGGRCTCQREKREYKHASFYDGKGWRALSRFIRVRDFGQDRLAMYFTKFKPEGKLQQRLFDYLIDAQGNPRRLGGGLVVHHIVPREDDATIEYEADNLISLNTHTHEYVHALYGKNKNELEVFLRQVVKAPLP